MISATPTGQQRKGSKKDWTVRISRGTRGRFPLRRSRHQRRGARRSCAVSRLHGFASSKPTRRRFSPLRRRPRRPRNSSLRFRALEPNRRQPSDGALQSSLTRPPCLLCPRLEHPFGEFQKRAVRAADRGAAFSAPLVLKMSHDLIGLDPTVVSPGAIWKRVVASAAVFMSPKLCRAWSCGP